MDKNSKDCVFSLGLMAFAVVEFAGSLDVYYAAAEPPFNIDALRVSPALLPLVLGAALFGCGVLLLLRSLKGDRDRVPALAGHLGAFSSCFRQALREPDTWAMGGGVAIMGAYSFYLIEALPFWLSASLFLAALMLYLRVRPLWALFLVSAGSVFVIVTLFETVFKTVLPR